MAPGKSNYDEQKVLVAPSRPHKSRTIAPRFAYMRVTLERSGRGSEAGFRSAEHADTVIRDALLTAHGIAGSAALLYQILKYESQTQSVVVKSEIGTCEKIWTALSLMSEVDGKPGYLRVLKATPFLYALSREGP